MSIIGYKQNIELEFKLEGENRDYSIFAIYEKTIKDHIKVFNVSFWIGDNSSCSAGYKKYISEDSFEGTWKTIRPLIKTTVNKMCETNLFDLYVQDYIAELDCIGNMYLQEEAKRLKRCCNE